MTEQTQTGKLEQALKYRGFKVGEIALIKHACKEAGLKFVTTNPGIPSPLPKIEEIK